MPPSGPHAVHHAADLPLHGRETSRHVEQAGLGQTEPHALMRRAGLAVARLAMAVAPHAPSVAVAAGPGNNGGDGLEAAMHLHASGRRVNVALLADAARLPDDARQSLARARDAGVAIVDAWTAPGPDALLIDAILGLGARRPPDGPLAAAIGALNGHGGVVLSVDLPSGLDADTGQPIGDAAVRATHTLALLTLKPGLYTGTGRDHAGQVWFDPLGVVPSIAPDAVLTGFDTLRGVVRFPSHASHKGRMGDVLVIGGAPGMAGAAHLAARAALALGAGRVFVTVLDPSAHDGAQPELMHRTAEWALQPDVLSVSTVVCGCGGGDALQSVMPAVLHHAGRLVLDADALNAIAADAALADRLRRRHARGLPTVLTPHPLEAARLLGGQVTDVQSDRVRHAASLAERTRACVVLKGSGTVISAPGALPLVNPTGNALLASPGTGDVLAGTVGALWARGPSLPPRIAAAAAALLHGAAADRAATEGAVMPLTGLRLIEAMRQAANSAAAGA